MPRPIKKFTGGTKVADELNYMAEILNALLGMSVDGGELAIKPGVGATLAIDKDDLFRIAQMTSDLASASDGKLDPQSGTAKLLIPGIDSDNPDVIDALIDLENADDIDVHNRLGFSLSEGDLTLLIHDLRTGEWWPVGGGGSGETQILSFDIISSDFSDRSGLANIVTRSFSGAAYGSILSDSVVAIYDIEGCHLNEPNVDLTGRQGSAVLTYTTQTAADLWFGGSLAYAPEKYWRVFELCCADPVCEPVA